MPNGENIEGDGSGARAGGPGSGSVPLRNLNPPGPVDKPARMAGSEAEVHKVKFSGPGDAVGAHADSGDGTVLYTAQLRLIFWGQEWASTSSPVPMGTVVGDVQSIATGPYLDGLEQYGVSGAYVDRIIELTDEDPPNPFNYHDGEDRVSSLIDDNVVPEPDEENVTAIYVVLLPHTVAGVPLALPAGLRGEHTRLLKPDLGHLALNSIPVAWIGNNGTPDWITETFSHELVETLTDPDGSGWQVEPRSSTSWNEIADVCQSAYRLNGVSVSSYWSNGDDACIVPDQAFITFQVEWIWRPNRIEWLGGTDEDGNSWQLPRETVMESIRNGHQFKVRGASTHRESLVGIYYLDATHPYLATDPDGASDDNLLALPQRLPT
jgi:Protein of unknown function (DUF3892)